ncbi:MAG: phosphatidylinositol-3-phosphatase [Thermoleophilaceae bacterium]|nr:phosphatidylinositol-3-phosphatase [Thermoleophilaceae bacterium]
MRGRMRATAIALALAALCGWTTATAGAASPAPIKHVWIVVLENENYETTFGPDSKAPYLSKTLPTQGQLLTHYYATGHLSLDNYITMVSGQPPNPVTQSDCQFFQDFVGTVGADGVAVGQGCVYPAEVKTIADQLEAKGLTWKGYMEDQAASPTEPKTCRHPEINAHDETQTAKKDDQYAARHNPFVYFHSIIDRPICANNVLDLTALPVDLASKATTPNYSFITPDLCSDGHDEPCIDGRPGGLHSANDFLQEWIPKITSSPAYADGGLVIVTFDEAEDDASDCCNQPTGPNTPNNGGPHQGNGGGRIGAVLLSPYVKPGSVNDTPYNHYSLLRSTEDIFGVPHLAYAAQEGLKPFEEDVFNRPGGVPGGNNGGNNGQGEYPRPRVAVQGVPRGCVAKAFTARIKARSKHLKRVNVMVDRTKVASRRTKSFRVRVKVGNLRNGSHRLTARASDRKGRAARRTVVFRVCR